VDRKEYEALLVAIEHAIEASVSGGAGYPQGCRRGIPFHKPGRLEKTAGERDRLYNDSDVDRSDSCIDASARGYRDGCRGPRPEDN